MGEDKATRATSAARSYYDASDVDGFYAHAWGGEDIHVGVYTDPREAIPVATGRTVERLAGKLGDALGAGSTVLDMGSGYGGAARRLAGQYGCHVVALNISELQNHRHRALNAERGLDDRIDVVTGSFHDIPAPDGSFDVVWSQEALCHSGDRSRALREATRVLRPGGHLVFTDTMAAEDAPEGELSPLAERLRLTDLATPGFYVEQLRALDLAGADYEDLSAHMLTHYERLSEEVRSPAPELVDAVSPGYLERLRTNLPQVARACRDGRLRWGIFHGRHR
ncbi:methyltransferase domain-containing protein [Streptomyces sp. p1417]|uniref:Methyltransferase domain-containing protein n=1 Tax=Streptomyces typhae TaxID=2681492 RepID=A0A6L6X9P1_9ACTN|nr:class I SAM-dependent methyltransferase [Streptomyces typhae]MVO90381.1 methyltransferase domain-containing protein [Streptomyces typhae]